VAVGCSWLGDFRAGRGVAGKIAGFGITAVRKMLFTLAFARSTSQSFCTPDDPITVLSGWLERGGEK